MVLTNPQMKPGNQFIIEDIYENSENLSKVTVVYGNGMLQLTQDHILETLLCLVSIQKHIRTTPHQTKSPLYRYSGTLL